MVLSHFFYIRPQSLEEALNILALKNSEARIIAGGTDLVLALRAHLLPEDISLVDLSFLEELKCIEEGEGEVTIGALCTHAQIARSPLVRQYAPLLAQACAKVGTPQTRARGTIGGNIVHASPAADSIPPLLIHNSALTLRSAQGERRIRLEDFLHGPYRSLIEPNEMLTEIKISPLPEFSFGYERLIRRQAVGIARLIVCAAIWMEKGRIREARLACGAAAPVPFRPREAERKLEGAVFSPELAERVGEMVSAEMIERAGERLSAPYKAPVLVTLIRRALLQAAARGTF